MTTTPSTHPQLLIVDDDSITTDLLRHYAVQNHFKPVACSTYAEAVAFDWGKFSAVLLDLELPDGDGFELLCQARKHYPDLPCFILTSLDKADSAVSALKAGAVDYFTKPFDHALIFSSIHSTLPPPEKPRRVPAFVPGEWKSPAMVAAHEKLATAAGNDFPVLLIGEPGTGRRAVAQQIHSRSKRAKFPFATVESAGLDELALELELFGGELRQSTGSYIRRRGKIETAHRGTLFIQDIDRLPISLQGRLIDAIDKDTSAGMPQISDFRLIASSRNGLDGLVDQKDFRNDLFYRLETNAIHLPNLRDASEDIPIWCDRYLTEICLKQRARRPQFTKGALEAMMDYSWPGNLDQLRKTLEQIVIGSRQGLIGTEDLPGEIVHGAALTDSTPAKLTGLVARIDDLERISLISALDACNGNRRRAAKRLGVSLRTIYNMIDRHSLRNHPAQSSAQ